MKQDNLCEFLISGTQSRINYWEDNYSNGETDLDIAWQLYMVSKRIYKMASELEQKYKMEFGITNQLVYEEVEER